MGTVSIGTWNVGLGDMESAGSLEWGKWGHGVQGHKDVGTWGHGGYRNMGTQGSETWGHRDVGHGDMGGTGTMGCGTWGQRDGPRKWDHVIPTASSSWEDEGRRNGEYLNI